MQGLETTEFERAEAKPPQTPEQPTANIKTASAVGFGSAANLSHLLLPVSALTIAGLYWRRATTGLERHLKPVAISFLFLSLYEILSLSSLWRGTTNPTVAKLVDSFGPIWIAEQIVLLIGVISRGPPSAK